MSGDCLNGVEVIAGDRVLGVWLGPPPSVDGGERSEAAPSVEEDAMGVLVANRGYVRFAPQPGDCPRERKGQAAPLVKSTINPRIRRNSNGRVILYNSRTGIELIDGGFVRIAFAVFPRRLTPRSRFATASGSLTPRALPAASPAPASL